MLSFEKLQNSFILPYKYGIGNVRGFDKMCDEHSLISDGNESNFLLSSCFESSHGLGRVIFESSQIFAESNRVFGVLLSSRVEFA